MVRLGLDCPLTNLLSSGRRVLCHHPAFSGRRHFWIQRNSVCLRPLRYQAGLVAVGPLNSIRPCVGAPCSLSAALGVGRIFFYSFSTDEMLLRGAWGTSPRSFSHQGGFWNCTQAYTFLPTRTHRLSVVTSCVQQAFAKLSYLSCLETRTTED